MDTYKDTHIKGFRGLVHDWKRANNPRPQKKNLAALNASAEESRGPESLIVQAGNKADLFNYSQYVSARVSYKSDATEGIGISLHTPVNIIIFDDHAFAHVALL